MKTLGYLLLGTGLATSAAAQAPRLQGAYYTVAKERGFSSNLFVFVGRRFFYQHAGCLGIRTGEGIFSVHNGKLRLVFQQAAADTIPQVRLFVCAPTSTPTFSVRVVDEQGSLLPGATIQNTLKPGVGTITDATGTTSLTYSPAPHDNLLVSYVGYDPVRIVLPTAASQGFAVRLGPPYYFKAGDTLVFQLKRRLPGRLVLRPVFDLAEADTDASAIRYEHCGRVAVAEAKKQLARTQ